MSVEIKWRLVLEEEQVTLLEWKRVRDFLKKNNIKFHERRSFVFPKREIQEREG